MNAAWPGLLCLPSSVFPRLAGISEGESDVLAREPRRRARGVRRQQGSAGRSLAAGSGQAQARARGGAVVEIRGGGGRTIPPAPRGAAEQTVEVLGEAFVTVIPGLPGGAAGVGLASAFGRDASGVVALRRLGEVEMQAPRLAEPAEEQGEEEGEEAGAVRAPAAWLPPIPSSPPVACCDPRSRHGWRG